MSVSTQGTTPWVTTATVAGTVSVSGTVTVAGTVKEYGNPVGAFKSVYSNILNVGTTSVISAPGSGNALYIQTLSCTNTGAVVADSIFQDSSGSNFANLAVGAGELTTSISYPGGLQLGDNKGVQVTVGTNQVRVTITYTTGPVTS